MPPLPPAPHERKRGTVINDRERVTEKRRHSQPASRSEGEAVSRPRGLDCSSVLLDVLAMHTIEMIPKSMILNYSSLKNHIYKNVHNDQFGSWNSHINVSFLI